MTIDLHALAAEFTALGRSVVIKKDNKGEWLSALGYWMVFPDGTLHVTGGAIDPTWWRDLELIQSYLFPRPFGDTEDLLVKALNDSVMYGVCQECNQPCGCETFGDATEIAQLVTSEIAPRVYGAPVATIMRIIRQFGNIKMQFGSSFERGDKENAEQNRILAQKHLDEIEVALAMVDQPEAQGETYDPAEFIPVHRNLVKQAFEAKRTFGRRFDREVVANSLAGYWKEQT